MFTEGINQVRSWSLVISKDVHTVSGVAPCWPLERMQVLDIPALASCFRPTDNPHFCLRTDSTNETRVDL